MTLCAKCKKRKTCNRLCAKAEAYVNQDYVGRSYITVEDIDSFSNEQCELPYCENYRELNLEDFYFLTDKQLEVLDMYFNKGMSFRNIASKLGIYENAVYERYKWLIKKIQKRIRKKISMLLKD